MFKTHHLRRDSGQDTVFGCAHSELYVNYDWIIIYVNHRTLQMGFSYHLNCQERSAAIFMKICDVLFSVPISIP